MKHESGKIRMKINEITMSRQINGASMKHPEFTMSMFSSSEQLYKAKAQYFEKLVHGYEVNIGDPLGDCYIVVCSRDSEDPIKSRGAIAMETYTGKSDLSKAVDFANRVGDKYGEIVICKLLKVGDVALCTTIINSEI